MKTVPLKKIYLSLKREDYDFVKNELDTQFQIKEIEDLSYENYRFFADKVGAPYDWHLRPRIQNKEIIQELLKPPARFFVFYLES